MNNKMTPIQELHLMVYNMLTYNDREKTGGGIFIFDPTLMAENIINRLYKDDNLAEKFYK